MMAFVFPEPVVGLGGAEHRVDNTVLMGYPSVWGSTPGGYGRSPCWHSPWSSENDGSLVATQL